jgi:hypothetical protein
MEITREDCALMTYNPFDVPSGKYIHHYYDGISRKKDMHSLPHSEVYSSWSDKDVSALLSYILLAYDPNGPLAQERDLDYRFEVASATVKLPRKVAREIKNFGEFFKQVLLSVFRTLEDHRYTMWLALSKNYANQLIFVSKPMTAEDDPKKKNDAAFALNDLRSELSKLESSLFPSPQLKKLVNDITMEDELGSWAEKYSENGKWVEVEDILDED